MSGLISRACVFRIVVGARVDSRGSSFVACWSSASSLVPALRSGRLQQLETAELPLFRRPWSRASRVHVAGSLDPQG